MCENWIALKQTGGYLTRHACKYMTQHYKYGEFWHVSNLKI